MRINFVVRVLEEATFNEIHAYTTIHTYSTIQCGRERIGHSIPLENQVPPTLTECMIPFNVDCLMEMVILPA
jgi:hypothetical protein